MNLFLIPASPKNAWTLGRGVPYPTLEKHLSPEDLELLKKRSDTTERVACWAVTEAKRDVFASMQEGDHVLFAINDTDQFRYWTKICFKKRLPALGRELWKFVPGEPWNFVYFLRDVQRKLVLKRNVLSELGYETEFWLPGAIRISEERLSGLVLKHGSIDRLIAHLKIGAE